MGRGVRPRPAAKHDGQRAPPCPFAGVRRAQRVFEFLPQLPEPHPGASWGQDGSTALGRRHFTVLGSVWSDREVRTELRSPESPRSSPSVPFTRSGWRAPFKQQLMGHRRLPTCPPDSAHSWDPNGRPKSWRRNRDSA